MNIWRKIMSFFGVRPPTPPVTINHGLDTNDELDERLQCAVQHHKQVSREVISRSLDVVDKTAEATLSLKAIFDRAKVPGEASAEGAWELVSRGRNHDAHHP